LRAEPLSEYYSSPKSSTFVGRSRRRRLEGLSPCYWSDPNCCPDRPVRVAERWVAKFGMGEPGMGTLLLVLDLVGTFVFALSGAMAGVKHRLDLFGVLVLSYAAGNAGGITRDLLIGAVPPAAISDWRYLAVSLLAGIVTFWRPSIIDRLRSPALLFDAAGLGLFAVAGTQKA